MKHTFILCMAWITFYCKLYMYSKHWTILEGVQRFWNNITCITYSLLILKINVFSELCFLFKRWTSFIFIPLNIGVRIWIASSSVNVTSVAVNVLALIVIYIFILQKKTISMLNLLLLLRICHNLKLIYSPKIVLYRPYLICSFHIGTKGQNDQVLIH